ncbi:MAG: exo-beta-N-acetylmuramidase NamZ family protein, partial [Armatimonadota bacterium]
VPGPKLLRSMRRSSSHFARFPPVLFPRRRLPGPLQRRARWLGHVLALFLAALLSLSPEIGGVAAQSLSITRPGVDVLLESPGLLQGRRIGLVTHAAALTSTGEPTASALLRDQRLTVTALFAPEHGLTGTVPAGQSVPDVPGRVPTYSLYGATRRPTPEIAAAIDVFVVDLQDVGARAYTYVFTMALVMQAAREAGKPVVVLDRPNPQGGLGLDGTVLNPEYRSFIGMFPIPSVHGMTIGELAWLFNGLFDINAELTVVPMRGWTRRMTWDDTGLPWVRPSPNIITTQTPFYYAATGVLDGTNLSAGAGTPHAFQVVRSPWLDGDRLAARLNAYGLPGIAFAPHDTGDGMMPRRGIRLTLTDPLRFRPATTAVHILAEIRKRHGDELAFVPRNGRYVFDLVWGTDDIRKDIVRGAPAHAIVARWEPDLQRFQMLRSPYLIYP